MDFKTKYVIEANALLPENKTKVVISNEAYAIGEMLEELKSILILARLR